MRFYWAVIFSVMLPSLAIAQQQQTPCEEVRNIFATNVADLATQVREKERENTTLKVRLAEMEKKLTDHKEPVEPEKEKKP